MMITRFRLLHSVPLSYPSETSILGLSPDECLFVEEFYEENYITQHQISQGRIISSQDEDYGKQEIVPYSLPTGSIVPNHPQVHPLNYRGLRWRGLREEERVMDWLLPLSLMEKMPLLKALSWDLPAMMLLGIAESFVLAEANLGDEKLVCRRIRLAYALPDTHFDDEDLAYNYDSRVLYCIHRYDAENELAPPLAECFAEFMGVQLHRPMDLLYAQEKLYLLDSGELDRHSNLYILGKQ